MVPGAPSPGVRLGRDRRGGRRSLSRPWVAEMEGGHNVEHAPHADRANPGKLGHFRPLLTDPALKAPDVCPVGGGLPDPIVVRELAVLRRGGPRTKVTPWRAPELLKVDTVGG